MNKQFEIGQSVAIYRPFSFRHGQTAIVNDVDHDQRIMWVTFETLNHGMRYERWAFCDVIDGVSVRETYTRLYRTVRENYARYSQIDYPSYCFHGNLRYLLTAETDPLRLAVTRSFLNRLD